MKLIIGLLLLAALPLLMACIVEVPTETPAVTPEQVPTATPITDLASTPTALVSVDSGRSIKQYAEPPLMTINPNSNFTAAIRTNKGDITIELFAADAPMTVNNFVFLAREKFYDGVVFHRVMKDFMIQTGDPKGNGTGGPGYTFDDEPVTRSYTKGIVAMANAGPNTNGSQFFIVHAVDAGLPPNYTIFGQVIEGIETVDVLANTPVRLILRGGREELSDPTEVLRIETIEISESN